MPRSLFFSVKPQTEKTVFPSNFEDTGVQRQQKRKNNKKKTKPLYFPIALKHCALQELIRTVLTAVP